MLFQKERARARLQTDQSKTNVLQCTVKWQTYGTQGLLGCANPWQLHFSDSKSTAHKTCLAGSGQLHP